MNNSTKPRFVVPAAMAILLTFGRNGMLPFEEGAYTLLDHAMNIFVVIVAPFYIFKTGRFNNNFRLLNPLFWLILWVTLRVIFSPSEYWPDLTSLITIFLSILIASQITSYELRRVRHFMLLLAGIFTIYAYFFARSSLDLIFSGALDTRLGTDLSSANLIIFPRIMNMLITTGLISLMIDKNKLVKIYAILVIILPLIIAISGGGRGSFVGTFIAILAFITSRLDFRILLMIPVLGIIINYTYQFIIMFLPAIETRLSDDASGLERLDTWNYIFSQDITLFGTGRETNYPHNIFLEFYYNYGVIGFILFLIFLITSLKVAYKSYSISHDDETRWAISLLVLQLTAQQFSLDIFYGSLWAALVLPLGFGIMPNSNILKLRKFNS